MYRLSGIQIKKSSNQEINGMNAYGRSPGMNTIKVFPQINAEYAFGIRPNQRYECYRAFTRYERL